MLARTALGSSTLLALTLSFGASATAFAQSQDAVTIDVDATAVGAPLERVWAFHGYDEVNYTTTQEGEELLRTLVAAHTAPVHVRTHFLFNTGDGTPALKWGSTNVYSEDARGTPIYDYSIIDAVMSATLDAGAFPFFELGFMPQALSTHPDPYQNSGTYAVDGGCFYPPLDYAKWGELVSTWATHVSERYAGAEANWQWELWNEPDTGYWHGTFDEYAELYDYTEAALHAALPDASLGGPAVASVESGFLSQFLEHCATGTNAASGQIGTRLDMVSFHAKGGVSTTSGRVQLNLGNQLHLHNSGFTAVAASGLFARTPIVISEADPDGCAACPVSLIPADAYRNSSAYGAYEVEMMKRSLELAAQANVDLRGVLTWAFTFPGSPYFAGYRALATNGIHLPVLNAFKLLGSLLGDRMPVTSSGALQLSDILTNSVRAQPDVDALAARDGAKIQILVWNYHDLLTDAAPSPVTLNVAVPPGFGTRSLVTHTRVDDTHGNAYTVWVSQGSPTAPSDAQLAALRAQMEPVALEPPRVVGVTAGTVSLSFDLPRFGISLVTLTPATDAEPEVLTPRGGGCACRSAHGTPTPRPTLLALGLFFAWVHRRRARTLR
ncbi:MAG TPA: MYXO-CTERM sorting domain-containing protein [Polyangiaceae bacterium]|jgi:xylan 1,4-beta-xylosidase